LASPSLLLLLAFRQHRKVDSLGTIILGVSHRSRSTERTRPRWPSRSRCQPSAQSRNPCSTKIGWRPRQGHQERTHRLCSSDLILYTQADLRRSEADDQVNEFVAFWKKIAKSVSATLVFDSRFTNYRQLAKLDEQGVRFITLRRRGVSLIHAAEHLPPAAWTRVTIPHPKRKFQHTLVNESCVRLPGYPTTIRQIIMRDNGHERPTFLITNDDESPVDLLVSRYARRWNIENGLTEAVKFFNLNALSSSILVKVHFDVVLTMIADTLYYLLARRLRGFEKCDAPRIFRHFIRGKGQITVGKDDVVVRFPKRAHNSVLRSMDWTNLPDHVTWLGNRRLRFEWQ
jgi:hypothetical protein